MSKKVIAGVLSFILAVVVLILILVNTGGDSKMVVEDLRSDHSVSYEQSSDGVIVSPAGVMVEDTYTIVEDFACGYCKELHNNSKPVVKELLERGEPVAFEYVFVRFLGGEQSWSEFTALYVDQVVESAPEKSLSVIDYFYNHDGVFGSFNEELVKANEESGLNIALDDMYAGSGDLVEKSLDYFERGITGTPTILKNGEVLGDLTVFMSELNDLAGVVE